MSVAADRQHVLEAISEDTTAFISLGVGLQHHARFPLVAPLLMPHMAMYVLESRRAIGDLFPEFAAAVDDEAAARLAGPRRRAKLLGDRDKSVELMASELAEVAATQTAFFLESHTGVLAPLKRALQSDLSLSVCDGHVFSTTHFTAAILGWEPGMSEAAMGQKAHAAGYSVGEYAAAIWAVLGMPAVPPITATALSGDFGLRDVKSPDLYRRGVLGRMPEELSVGATSLLASLNFVRYVLEPALPPDALTTFKLKLITAFHADSNLKYMQDRLIGSGQCAEASDLLKTVFGNSDSRWLRKQGAMRNILVHYLADETAGRLSPMGARRGQVLEQAGRSSMAEMTDRLDRHILRLSAMLEDGFDLLGDPFSDRAVSLS